MGCGQIWMNQQVDHRSYQNKDSFVGHSVSFYGDSGRNARV